MQVINQYKQFVAEETIRDQLRNRVRKTLVGMLALKKNISNQNNWIRFPYYHHVFDDEKKGFARQLKYLKNFGDFISMDEACTLISDEKKIEGRYFCVSFDDGFYNCFSNMMEISFGLDVPVIIYLPTNYIDLTIEKEQDRKKVENFYPEHPRLVPFLNWNQCREMLAYKVSFGSHTLSHANLSRISEAEIEKELSQSKKTIEENLNRPCIHFACPWGRPGIDFYEEKTTPIAKRTGYKSFATTARGKMNHHSDLYLLKRDHLLAQWENYQLRYFFSL